MSGAVTALGGLGGATGLADIIALRRQIIDRSELLQQLHAPRAAGAAGTSGAAEPAGGFAAALKSAIGGVSETQAKAESITEAYQKGEVTDVAKVMLAREESGVAFEATLQVRNRLLTAYQEIMRMGV